MTIEPEQPIKQLSHWALHRHIFPIYIWGGNTWIYHYFWYFVQGLEQRFGWLIIPTSCSFIAVPTIETLSNRTFWDMEMVCICIVQYSSHMWLLHSWNVASTAEELNFKFFLILINLPLNSHMWLVAIVLESTIPEFFSTFSVFMALCNLCCI